MPARRKPAVKKLVLPRVVMRPVDITRKYENRFGFIPAGRSHTDQFGKVLAPDTVDRWVYEDAQDEDSYVDDCLKQLLENCVPDEVQTIELVLLIADIYREAKGLK